MPKTPPADWPVPKRMTLGMSKLQGTVTGIGTAAHTVRGELGTWIPHYSRKQPSVSKTPGRGLWRGVREEAAASARVSTLSKGSKAEQPPPPAGDCEGPAAQEAVGETICAFTFQLRQKPSGDSGVQA